MTAHWVVLAAAALTTLVAAAVGAALAVFAGQALPLAVRHDLSVASGTSLSVTGAITGSDAQAATGQLQTAIGAALHGVPYGFWSANWSDPLDLVRGALPAPPASAGKGNTPLLQAAAMEAVTSHAVLVSGRWPTAPDPPARSAAGKRAAAAPIPAALPASAATLLHVSPGDVLRLKDRASNALVTFQITGLFAPRRMSGTAASYWELNSIPSSGQSTLGGFVTYGPLVVSPAAFSLPGNSAGTLTVGSGTWVAQPDMSKFTDTDLSAISGNVSALQSQMRNSVTLSGMQVFTSLPAVLAGTARDLAVARALLVISALQLLVLAVAALLAVARLLVTQRENESALLAARGATRWQLARLTANEVIPLCGIAAIVGGLIGIRLSSVLSSAGPLGAAGIRLPGLPALLGGGGAGSPAGTWLDAASAVLAIAVIAVASMLAAVLSPALGRAQARRGRQAVIANATRAGADLAIIVLAALAGWQLRRYSAVSNGATGNVDPVLALAPALALAGGTVLTLRLLPALARAGDRLASRGRRLTASLAGWQVSRLPLRQGGAALLLVMAVATGTLALSQHASWDRSAGDQAAFATGANVRVDLPAPLAAGATGTVTDAPGVRSAMAVSVDEQALPSDVLAIDAAQAPNVALLRPDQSALTPSALFGKITPDRTPGTEIPGHPAAIRLTAALGPAASGGTQLAPVTVGVTVVDATGNAYQIPAGTLNADGRPQVLTASLGGTRATYPLRLVQVSLDYTLPARRVAPLTLTLSGADLAGWRATASSSELSSLQATPGGGTMDGFGLPGTGTWRPAGDGATLTFAPGWGQAAANPGLVPPGPAEPVYGQVTLGAPASSPKTVPAIATKAFLDANNAGIGSVVQATVESAQFPVTIVAETTSFPTVTGSGGALIVDLSTLQDLLVTQNAEPLHVNEWWLSTMGGQVPQGLAAGLPPGSTVTTQAQATAVLTGDPLSAAPQQALLAMAGAAVLLAITGFWVSIAANVRQRGAENALLAALGVSQRSAALQLFLEKLMLSGPSALLGVVLGIVVARLLVPAVTLTPAAQQPVPPPVTLLDLSQTVPLAVAVAVIPPLAAAFIMFRRPDPAAELRAAQA